MVLLATVPLLNMDNPGMRESSSAAAELIEIFMRHYELASTLLTSNGPVEDWGKLLGDSAAVTAMLTASSITVTFSNVAHGAGQLKWTCLVRRQRGRTTWSRA